MNGDGRPAGDRFDDLDGARAGRGRGRPALYSALTWMGVTAATLVVVVTAVVSRGPAGDEAREPSRGRFRWTSSSLGAVAFAPDGRGLALGHFDGSLEIRDLSRGGPVELEAAEDISGTARAVAFSPDGLTLASGGRGLEVKLWDVASWTLRASLPGHASPVGSLAFSPDGLTLASGSADGSVKLWDVAEAREILDLAGHAREVKGLAFSPDGKAVASGSADGSVKLRDVADGRVLASLPGGGPRVYSLAFAPDGQSLAFSVGASRGIIGQVFLWAPGDGRRPVRALGLASFASVAFSPDGKTLAIGGGERMVKLWDVETGKELASLGGHEGYIASLAFSPDGRLIATGGHDSLVGLFEIGAATSKPPDYRL